MGTPSCREDEIRSVESLGPACTTCVKYLYVTCEYIRVLYPPTFTPIASLAAGSLKCRVKRTTIT